MKLVINLEDGDRFLYFLDKKLIQDVEQLINHLQSQLKEDYPKRYILFIACKQTDPEPIKILKQLKELTNEFHHLYFYPYQTMLKLTNCSSLWTFRSDINDQIKTKISSSDITSSDDKPKFNQDDAGDEIDHFQFDSKIHNQLHLTQLVQQAAKNQGFQVKLIEADSMVINDQQKQIDDPNTLKHGLNPTNPEVNGAIAGKEAFYLKYQCAYPLKQCRVYLIYKYEIESMAIIFSAFLTHNHQLGPIKIN